MNRSLPLCSAAGISDGLPKTQRSIVAVVTILLACRSLPQATSFATEPTSVKAFQARHHRHHRSVPLLRSTSQSREFLSTRQHPRNVTSSGPLYFGSGSSPSSTTSSSSSSTSSKATATATATIDTVGDQRRSVPFLNTDSDSVDSKPTLSSILQRKTHLSLNVPDNSSKSTTTPLNIVERVLSGFWGPRIVLAAVACFYATNFPLGTIMADAMPSPAAVTSARMFLAALALSPFIAKLDPSLRIPAVAAGCCTSTAYITQSMALVDTSPATVSFLGSATVLVCPFLEWAVDKKPMSWNDAPQTWLAAILCLLGVACLELLGASDAGVSATAVAAESNSFFHGGMGDLLALVQAVGFGTQMYLCERMVVDKPDQALPVTATLVATAAALSGVWCVSDGWMSTVPDWRSYTLPGLFFEPSMQTAATAILWTGIVSTALAFLAEMNALSRVPPAQASVILATEPMWTALFAAGLLGETFGAKDVAGGMCMVAACIVSGLKTEDLQSMISSMNGRTTGESAPASTSNAEPMP